MVKTEDAGKGRFEKIKSQYMQSAVQPEQPAVETEEKTFPQVNNLPKKSIENKASTLIDEVVSNADMSIKKRRHPRYKGERITRTYKILTSLDEWMDQVYQEEGIEKQAQVTKALQEWLGKNYPDIKG